MVTNGGVITGFPKRIIRLCGQVPFPALAAAVGLLFAVAGVAALDDYGVGADELVFRNDAIAAADYIMGDRDALPTDHNRFYGIAFELPLLLVERFLNLQDSRDIFLSRHLLIRLFFIVGGFFCGLLAYRMFGSRWAGLLAMLLFLLHPRLYAHSFYNSKDIPFLVMFVIALYLTHRAFRKDTVVAFALLGVVVGLAINVRPFALLLLPAALAMRGMDWRFASGPLYRRRILVTGGVFAAAVLLAIYVSHPYYWENPLRFIDGLRELSQHPTHTLNLFQGEFFRSYAVPPHYIPVWFGITAPPVALMLGGVGAAGVCWRGLRAPGRMLRQGELRFLFLLLGCFLLPVAAAIVLEANIYNGWRHMYFLWAPFCLLAVAGLRWLAGNVRVGGGKKRLNYLNPARRAAAYVLAGASLAGAVTAIVSLHPYQHIYFNFLVDRGTEESLREQFDMDYWGLSYRQGMEYLLERYPQLPLYIQGYSNIAKNSRILTEETRERLFFVNREDADFRMANDFVINQWKNRRYQGSSFAEVAHSELPGPVIYRIKAHNNTILTITAPGLADSSPAELAAAYRAKYEGIISNELVIDDLFDVYISSDGGTLYYARAGCATGDASPWFYLHIFPKDERDLPPDRRQYGFENLAFASKWQGGRMDDKCWVTAPPLPDYPIAHIRTGQSVQIGGALWQADVNLSVFKQFQEIEAGLGGLQPAVKGVFDLYLDGDRAVYYKDGCAAEDMEARFFLHTFPVDINSLPADRREYGFGNLGFEFSEYGARRGGKCLAAVALPGYEIARIRVGQYVPGEGEIWRAEFAAGDGGRP